MEPIRNIMLEGLVTFYHLTGSYGWAIILLTVVVKLILYPLSIKQFHSMHGMKKIQPKIKALQKKHKDKPEQMQKELIKVYQENKVNPLGGCLPLIIQLPMIIALFSTLRSTGFMELAGDKSFLWISNLSQPDMIMLGQLPIPIMAFIVGITTYVSQSAMTVDKDQQKMMAFMPFMLFFISINMNSGVLLYWSVSNILTTFQQKYIEKKIAEKGQTGGKK